MKRTGDKVIINGHEYELGEKLGGGMEGSVFVSKDRPEFVIKLINTAHMGNRAKLELREHLMWLKNTIGANNDLKNKLAVPKALVEGDDIGYIMYRATEHDSLKSYITFPSDIQQFEQWYKLNYKLKKRLQIASYLFNSLELIHISGLLFTDLSPNNIMVHKNKNNLVFIDTDNMRRKRDSYLSVVGTDGYMAPEIYIGLNEMNKKINSVEFDKSELPKSGRLSIESDVFSAAVIVFQLLTLQHPFIGDAVEDGTAEDETAALRCETDYILHKNKSNISSTPFVQLFDKCQIVTPKIRDLFYRTFVDGKNNPYLRPTAIEFAEAFDEAQDLLASCEKCGSDFMYLPETENLCWDCENRTERRVVLQIFTGYEEADREKLIADILRDNPLCGTNQRYRFVEACSVILEENKDKYLYLRHFEKTTKRSHPFAKIALVDTISGTIRLQVVDTSIIPACYLIDRRSPQTRKRIDDLRRANEFSMEQFAILFDVVQSRVGKIETIGMLSRK
ncbi:MAG: serine/threonine protein kinase [Clostridiales bacterium]|nr:serine/threonine protein kinase [Clostridiales bacterium]